MQALSPNTLLTRAEVGKRLQVSRTTLKRWAKEGRLHPIFLSPHVLRYREADVSALLYRGYHPGSASKPGPKPQAPILDDALSTA